MSTLKPRPLVTWDKVQRIIRHQEIWNDPQSVVHRLPLHYKSRYWTNLLRDRTPVHWRPFEQRYSFDPKRNLRVNNQNYPIVPIYPPEADKGLWGGEGVLKGYELGPYPFKRKKTVPRNWIPKFWWPTLERSVFYSEILDKYMIVTVTPRTYKLIDECGGFDSYILKTPEIDLCSKLGNKLKRLMLVTLSKKEFHLNDAERHDYVARKYAEFTIDPEEADWVGYDLNEAARKQQDLEELRRPMPKKLIFEQQLVESLKNKIDDSTPEGPPTSTKEKAARLISSAVKHLRDIGNLKIK